MADNGVFWQLRWWEAVSLDDDAAPPERSTGEQQRAGRRRRESPPCRLVDEDVFTGSRERVEGGIVGGGVTHPADLIKEYKGRGESGRRTWWAHVESPA